MQSTRTQCNIITHTQIRQKNESRKKWKKSKDRTKQNPNNKISHTTKNGATLTTKNEMPTINHSDIRHETIVNILSFMQNTTKKKNTKPARLPKPKEK